MEYELSIREDNVQQHLDLEKYIKERKNGLFTFILRINNGKIVDINILEYVDAKQKYLKLESVTFIELTTARDYRAGDEVSAVWPDDGERDA